MQNVVNTKPQPYHEDDEVRAEAAALRYKILTRDEAGAEQLRRDVLRDLAKIRGPMDITDEAATAAADAMALSIQKATDIPAGDIAGVFFSGPEMQALKDMAARLLKAHQV